MSLLLKGADTIGALKKEYGDKIRVVFKDLPLSFHKDAELRRAQPTLRVSRASSGRCTTSSLTTSARSEPTPSRASPKSLAGHGEVGEGSQQPVHEGEGRG